VANTQAAFGFRHIGYLSGGSPDFQLATGIIAQGNATKIFRGDPVVRNPATGMIERASANVANIVGVFDGCMYTPVGGTPQWSPAWPGAAGSDATAYIIDAPNAVFLAAATLNSVQVVNIGENIGFAIGTGNIATGQSGATIDVTTLNTTATLPFRVVTPCTTQGNYGIIGNGSDPSTPYGWAVVTFNNQNYKQLAGLA
jgi:hypothetical protein